MKIFKVFIAVLFLNIVSCNSEKVENVSVKTEDVKAACCSKKDCKKDDGACAKKETEGACCAKKECSKQDAECKKDSVK